MKILIDMPEETYNKMRRGEALYSADANVAIFAIETGTPLEECEDAISRQAVIDIIEDVCPIYGNDYRYILRDKVNELPPVNPAEKVGQWKRISMDKYSEHAKYWYRCDRCGEDNLGNTNYCPNCGQRKMPNEASPTGAESENKE